MSRGLGDVYKRQDLGIGREGREREREREREKERERNGGLTAPPPCRVYTSDGADDAPGGDRVGGRGVKKKKSREGWAQLRLSIQT
mgnify:CR=1 FL=1